MKAQKKLTIKNRLGLHARAAAQFVKTANRFSSEIKVVKDRTTANGKSIMGILTLAAAQGSSIQVICEGPDANEALQALQQLVEERFKEE